MEPDPLLLPPKLAARFLGLREETLRALSRRGIAPARLKVGRAVYYHRTDLIEFAERVRKVGRIFTQATAGPRTEP